MKMTNHSPLILQKWDENDEKDEYHTLLWKFKNSYTNLRQKDANTKWNGNKE